MRLTNTNTHRSLKDALGRVGQATAFCILLFLSGSLSSATSIVLTYTADQIVIAADSKTTNSRQLPSATACKLHVFDGVIVANGAVLEASTGFSVLKLAEGALKQARGDFSSQVSGFQNVLVGPLLQLLRQIKANRPQEFRSQVQDKPVVSIVFATKAPNGLLEAAEREWVAHFRRDRVEVDLYNATDCPSTKCSDGHYFVLGESSAIGDALKSDAHLFDRGPIEAVRRLMAKQIAATPETVGPPIDVIVLNRTTGIHVLNGQGCDKSAFQ